MAVAGRLQSCLRAGELLARFGGEEFSILLPAIDPETALRCAERILAAISTHPVTVDGQQLSATISIGLVTMRGDQLAATTIPALLKEVDLALYRAKAEGRNRVVVGGAVGNPGLASLYAASTSPSQ
jgi:diguanylate cyclase (GGDEF)-like protein